jgi:rare lipoprotein A
MAAPKRSGSGSIVVASWYGPGFHGRRTASGQVFDQKRFTAAHKTLPFGTRLRVTNLRNGRSVLVTVNDRGPFVRNRQLDLSLGAARHLGIVQPGTAPVLIEKL